MDTRTAQQWLQRWDRQQEGYIPNREERFTVMADALQHILRNVDAPVILDLGCGPGSLGARLAEALPGARIIGLDADPLLLELGRAAYGDVMEFRDAELSQYAWTQDLPDRIDAAVSTTALHWLTDEQLVELYARLAAVIQPGGAYLNGDHIAPGSPGLDEVAVHVAKQRGLRVGITEREDWDSWWRAARADGELAPLVDQRSDRAIAHHGSNSFSTVRHEEVLRKAGFAEAGSIWRFGDDQVLLAMR